MPGDVYYVRLVLPRTSCAAASAALWDWVVDWFLMTAVICIMFAD